MIVGDWLERAESVQGWMEKHELEWLHRTASNMTSVVEIGCWRGRSTIALLSGCNGTVHCVDHFKGSDNEKFFSAPNPAYGANKEHDIHAEFQQNTTGYDNKIVYLEGSPDAAARCPDVDMVFIDGNHSYYSVLNDIRVWRPKAKKMVCGHDINWEGVGKAVREEFADTDINYGPGAIWYYIVACD